MFYGHRQAVSRTDTLGFEFFFHVGHDLRIRVYKNVKMIINCRIKYGSGAFCAQPYPACII